jgi:NADH:ubiquinone oxidoreductase subunit 6 (subunit J)
MIAEIIVLGLLIAACLAVYFDEPVYAVASLAVFFFFTVLLYALNGAGFAAVFTLAMGAGTVSVLFLASEMLSEKSGDEKSLRGFLLAVSVACILVVPPALLSIGKISAGFSSALSFEQTFWNLRAMDIILQGLVILSVAIGVAIILYERE